MSDPLDDLTPWGYDPLTPAQIAAARRALRPAHYREAAESLRALDYMGAADLLDSVARDLDDEQSADYQNEPEGEERSR